MRVVLKQPPFNYLPNATGPVSLGLFVQYLGLECPAVPQWLYLDSILQGYDFFNDITSGYFVFL